MFKTRNAILFSILSLTLLLSLLLNISLGQVAIPLKEVFKSLLGSTASKDTWEYIIFNFRLPKAITAVLVGVGLSISGLLMQTLFRNPLAGPYVLGLSSGSSLGVAIIILSSNYFGFAIFNFDFTIIMSLWLSIIPAILLSTLFIKIFYKFVKPTR